MCLEKNGKHPQLSLIHGYNAVSVDNNGPFHTLEFIRCKTFSLLNGCPLCIKILLSEFNLAKTIILSNKDDKVLFR